MARRSIRTKSGRLRAGERRRRLAAANLAPGDVLILDVSRRAKKGKRSKGALQAEMVVSTQIGADTDIRKLLHQVRLALARHYQAQLLAGERPDGNRGLPPLKETTMRRNPGRPASFGVLSGELARRWLLFKIRGGPLAASTRIKPWGGEGRRFAINRWLRFGIDLQSVDGAAAKVIQQEIAAWLPRAAPASGDGVATPARPTTKGGELPRFK